MILSTCLCRNRTTVTMRQTHHCTNHCISTRTIKQSHRVMPTFYRLSATIDLLVKLLRI